MRKKDFLNEWGQHIISEAHGNYFLKFKNNLGAVVCCDGHWSLSIVLWTGDEEFYDLRYHEMLNYDVFEDLLKSVRAVPKDVVRNYAASLE